MRAARDGARAHQPGKDVRRIRLGAFQFWDIEAELACYQFKRPNGLGLMAHPHWHCRWGQEA